MSNKPKGKRSQCIFAAMQGDLDAEQVAAECFRLNFHI